MFDVGFWELSLIAIVALVIVGPERLPSLVSEAGKWAGRARGTIRDLKYDLQRHAEIEQLSELGKDFKNTTDSINPHGLKKNLRDLIDDAESKTQAEINDVIPGEIQNDLSQDIASGGIHDNGLAKNGAELRTDARDTIDPDNAEQTIAEATSGDTSKTDKDKTNRTS